MARNSTCGEEEECCCEEVRDVPDPIGDEIEKSRSPSYDPVAGVWKTPKTARDLSLYDSIPYSIQWGPEYQSAEIGVATQLSAEEKDLLLGAVHTHKGVFKKRIGRVKDCAECVHQILLMENARPIRRYARPRSKFMRAVDDVFLKDLLSKNLIALNDGKAGWSSVAFYVLKDSGDPVLSEPGDAAFAEEVLSKYRRVIDLVVNQFVIADVTPLPDLWQLVKGASGYKYYIILDWRDAYFQLALALASQNYTAHGCGGKLVHYLSLPQGLVSASQRMQLCSMAL